MRPLFEKVTVPEGASWSLLHRRLDFGDRSRIAGGIAEDLFDTGHDMRFRKVSPRIA